MLLPIENLISPFKVQNPIAPGMQGCPFLHQSAIDTLKSSGYTKGTCPFGVLVVGTADFPDSYL